MLAGITGDTTMGDAAKHLARRIDDSRFAQGATLGLVAAYLGAWPLGHVASPLGYVATAFAGGAGYVALRFAFDAFLKPDRVPTGPVAVPAAGKGPMPDQGAESDLEARIAERLANTPERRALRLRRGIEAAGRIAERHGSSWLVYSSPDSEPVAMTEREYQRVRKRARDLVEIEPNWEGTKVTRLYLGRVDSSLKGLPSVQIHGDGGEVVRSEWHVEGAPCTEEEALAAHDDLLRSLAPSPAP